jgi:hypothetical protein
MRRQMQRHFHAVRIAKAGPPRLPERHAAIMYTNHPSWWDPALFMVLTTTLLRGRKGYGPMEAGQLERYGFMRRIGVFGIEPGTRRGAAAFQHDSAILTDPEAVLWVTAEARCRSASSAGASAPRHGTSDGPPRGRRRDPCRRIPFWSERLPEALCRFGEPPYGGDGGLPPAGGPG